jgi:ribosomal protein L24E
MYVKKTGAAKYYCSERCYKYDSVQRKKQRPKEQAEIAKRAAKK